MSPSGAPLEGMRPSFTPALGHSALTPLYDAAIAVPTREHVWRSRMIETLALRAGERLLDVGCGTGSLLLTLSGHARGASLTGLDPDREVLERARVPRPSVLQLTSHSYTMYILASCKHMVSSANAQGRSDNSTKSLDRHFKELPISQEECEGDHTARHRGKSGQHSGQSGLHTSTNR